MRKMWKFLRARMGGGQRGQVLILVAVGMVAIFGLVGMAVDVGQLVYTKADMQKTADAAAFAGAQDLPSSSAATNMANVYVGMNASNTSATIKISQTHNPNDTIRVTAMRRVNYTFLRALGLSGADVSASATVRVGAYGGGSGLVPWGLVASSNKDFLGNACFNGMVNGVPTFKQNQLCVLKYGAGTSAGGDFGALALDGGGGNIYRDSVSTGTKNSFHLGQQVNAETGNKEGPTGQGISARFALALPATCNTNDRNKILHTSSKGVTSITPGCEYHPRIIIIPVVDKIDNPSKSTILGFAFMFLHGPFGSGGQTGVHTEFVTFVTAIPGGNYTGPVNGSTSTTILLVE